MQKGTIIQGGHQVCSTCRFASPRPILGWLPSRCPTRSSTGSRYCFEGTSNPSVSTPCVFFCSFAVPTGLNLPDSESYLHLSLCWDRTRIFSNLFCTVLQLLELETKDFFLLNLNFLFFRYSPVGRSFYSPNLGTRKTLGEGLESWRGFYQSIRPTQMGLSLNIGESTTCHCLET